MAKIEEVSGVYGGVTVEENTTNSKQENSEKSAIGINNAVSIESSSNSGENLPVKAGFWNKVKGFFLQEIKIELNPYEQKIEKEINDFLHQDITWKKVKNFLFGNKKEN